MKAKLTFLGTGTSQGIPLIGCRCKVCMSEDSRDKRFRASALVEYGGLKILVDAGPDFRMQMLGAGIAHLDAILLTHNHKDHTGGMDDLRSLNYIDRRPAEIYCEQRVLDTLLKEYDYAFAEEKYPGAPEWRVHLIDGSPFAVFPNCSGKTLTWVHDVGYCYELPDGRLIPTGHDIVDMATKIDDPMYSGTVPVERMVDGHSESGIEIIPIRGYHGQMPVLGYRFGDIAYITDMSSLPEEEMVKLQNLEHLTLNTVSYKPHHSHFNLEQAVEIADKVGAKNTWLTHLSHNFPVYNEFCTELEQICREHGTRSIVRPAYDGLVIEDK